MLKHSKRYKIIVHEWGKRPDSFGKFSQLKSFFKCNETDCDTLEEVNEYINMINDMYCDIIRPDELSNYKDHKRKETRSFSENDWIYDDNHYFWGYCVADFESQKITHAGGCGLVDCHNPMKSLGLLDRCFRGDDEVPKDYVWESCEYEGWLKFRWGDGSNAIEKVRKRKEEKLKQEQLKRERLKQEKLEEDIYIQDVLNQMDAGI